MGHLVALSGLDANKFDKVSNWKRTANIVSTENTTDCQRGGVVVSEFGDLKITRLRQSQKHLSESETAQVITEYQNGMSTYQLAEKYGCHRATVTRTLKKNGINVTTQKITEKADEKRIVDMYENMFNSGQIAKEFGVNPQVITNCLRANGVRIRGRWDY